MHNTVIYNSFIETVALLMICILLNCPQIITNIQRIPMQENAFVRKLRVHNYWPEFRNTCYSTHKSCMKSLITPYSILAVLIIEISPAPLWALSRNSAYVRLAHSAAAAVAVAVVGVVSGVAVVEGTGTNTDFGSDSGFGSGPDTDSGSDIRSDFGTEADIVLDHMVAQSLDAILVYHDPRLLIW